MAKRFTDTEKWKDVWYMNLPLKYKLFWHYLLDDCDFSGVWEVNFKVAVFLIGEPFEPSEVKRILDGRIVPIDDDRKWFIPKFISFQYGNTLSRTNKPISRVIKNLEEMDLLRFCPEIKVSEGNHKGLPCSSLAPEEQEQDKEQDKEEEQEQEKGILKQHLSFKKEEKQCLEYYKLNTPEFLAKWEEWKTYRKLRKPAVNIISMKKQLKQLSEMVDPISSIDKSIANGWQGLFGGERIKWYTRLDGEEFEVINGLVEIQGQRFSVPKEDCYRK